MKYFPVFRRTIDVGRSDISTEEIANMMSKIDLIDVVRIDSGCVKCRRPSFGKNNIVPDVDIYPEKKENVTQLHCEFHLRKETQILLYIYTVLAAAVQIGVLIKFWGELTLPCFVPIGIIALAQLMTYVQLHDDTGVITHRIKSKTFIGTHDENI